ncbi:MAG TPA: hypothetical protein VMW29_03820 [Candidatus Bathyarchaeia archaeon]|nr:hypothetical protein [Candidatus Bathyarchaeia archaeon]
MVDEKELTIVSELRDQSPYIGIEKTESLVPHMLDGSQSQQIARDLLRGGAVELLPRLLDGPYPSVYPDIRQRLLLAIGLPGEELDKVLETLQVETKTTLYEIYADWDDLRRSLEAAYGKRDIPKKGIVLAPEDPLMVYLSYLALNLSNTNKEQFLVRDALKDTTLLEVDEFLERLVREDEKRIGDLIERYVDRDKCLPAELFRPALKHFNYEIRGSRGKEEFIWTGGSLSQTGLAVAYIQDCAFSGFIGAQIFESLIERGTQDFENVEQLRAFYAQASEEAFRKMGPSLQRLILSQGLDPDLYNPFNWRVMKKGSFETITYDKWIAEITKGVPREYNQQFLSFLANISAENRIITDFLAGVDVAPRPSESERPDIVSASVAVTAGQPGTVIGLELPETQKQWQTWAPNDTFVHLNGEFPGLLQAAGVESFEDLVKRYIHGNEKVSYSLIQKAREIMDGLEFHSLEDSPLDLDVKYQAYRKSIDPQNVTGSSGNLEQWQQTRGILDAIYGLVTRQDEVLKEQALLIVPETIGQGKSVEFSDLDSREPKTVNLDEAVAAIDRGDTNATSLVLQGLEHLGMNLGQMISFTEEPETFRKLWHFAFRRASRYIFPRTTGADERTQAFSRFIKACDNYFDIHNPKKLRARLTAFGTIYERLHK